ncbi:MAG: hypothetical protein IJW00_07900 [Clostridia bacterium]|nr:hypothetical protein [Clostridia bacterium]
MCKKRKNVLFVMCGLLLVLFVGLICYNLIQNGSAVSFVWEEDDLSSYIQQDYITKDGGTEAASFFPSYEQVNVCEHIEFKMQGYHTIFAPSPLLAYKTAYMLKLSFSHGEEEEYLALKNSALEGTNYDVSMLDPTMCILTDGHSSFPDQVAIIVYDDKNLELFYIFYYDTAYEDSIQVDSGFLRNCPFVRDILYDTQET